MKKIVVLILIVVLLFVGLYVAKDLIAKSVLTGGVKAITGLKLSIGRMNVGILNTLIGVKEMKLYNPPDFVDKLMVDMPEIYID